MPRPVALRMNGVPVQKAAVRNEEGQWKLVITDPILGQFSPGEDSRFELLELVIPPDIRRRLPHEGWRMVSLRLLIMKLGNRFVKIADWL